LDILAARAAMLEQAWCRHHNRKVILGLRGAFLIGASREPGRRKSMAKLSVTVSIKDEHLSRFPEVVEGMKKTGFEVDKQLESLGVVTGKIDSDRVHELRALKGIGNVEESRSFQIAPPESEIQ